MNDGGDHNANPFCCFHPRVVVVGVCALCLKEKLLVLASKQGRGGGAHPEGGRRGSFSRAALSKKPAPVIPRVFALGSSFLRLDSRHQNPGGGGGGGEDDDSDEDSLDSLNDSFISIKFEDDGQASWDKKVISNFDENSSAGSQHHSAPKATAEAESMIEHATRPPRGGMRWRRRIGNLLLRLRTSKASVCHVRLAGKAEGAEGRKGWARRRTTE